MKPEETQQPLMIFLGLTFALSIFLSIIVGATGGAKSNLAGLGPMAMLFPGLAVLIMKFVFKAPVPDAGWTRFPLKWLPAIFIIPIAIHAICLPVTALLNDYTLPWQSWLTPDENGLYHTPDEGGWGVLTAGGLAFRIFQNALVGIIVVSIFAFFEEIGWRAWMLPRFVNRFNI